MRNKDLRSAILGDPVRRAVGFMLSRGVSSRRSGSFGLFGVNFGIEAEFKMRSLDAFLLESRSVENADPDPLPQKTDIGGSRIQAE